MLIRKLLLLFALSAAVWLAVVAFASRGGVPNVKLRKASTLAFAGQTDCNTPAHWDNGTLYLFNPFGPPWKTKRSSGSDFLHLEAGPFVKFDSSGFFPFVESTWKDQDGTLYGWYHTEFKVCEKENLSAARIGAARSEDDGLNWQDLGIIIIPPEDSLNCESANLFFAGGNGDFSVIVDQTQQWVYFLISTYHKSVSEQGVSIARMRFADRDHPVGKVGKWHNGDWAQPGLGGRVTPIFPVTVGWHEKDSDAYWGPSIHWNTHLEQYAVIINRTLGKDWVPEGFYISFNPDISNPEGWSPLQKLTPPDGASSLLHRPPGLVAQFEIPGNADWDDWGPWYPQVLGMDAKRRETDKRAGQTARLFIHGESRWEIVFSKQ